MRNQNEQVYKLPVTIMRGGTSKGIYILQSDLPENREEWDAILLRLMGSPDSKQIDGLGGSQSVTSKVAIVGKILAQGGLRDKQVFCCFRHIVPVGNGQNIV